MKTNRRVGFALVGMGAVLLIAALLLSLHNGQESTDAGQAADEALTALQEAIEQNNASTPRTEAPTVPIAGETGTAAATEPTVTETTVPGELKVVTMDGHEYVGYLAVPSLDLKLPVMKLAYLEDLQIAPCLQSGSPLSDDAVIAAHNYPSHFGPLRDMKGGESVSFTDMDGNTIEYTVKEVKTIDPYAVEEVMDSPYDLVLYTCTTGGQNRVMIACDRI